MATILAATTSPRPRRDVSSPHAAWRHLPFLAGLLTTTALVVGYWVGLGATMDMLGVAAVVTVLSTIWIALSIITMGSRVHFGRSQGASIVSYFLAAYFVIGQTGSGDSAFLPMVVVPLLWLTLIGERWHTRGALLAFTNILALPVVDPHWAVPAPERLTYAALACVVVVVTWVTCLACNSLVRSWRDRRRLGAAAARTTASPAPVADREVSLAMR